MIAHRFTAADDRYAQQRQAATQVAAWRRGVLARGHATELRRQRLEQLQAAVGSAGPDDVAPDVCSGAVSTEQVDVVEEVAEAELVVSEALDVEPIDQVEQSVVRAASGGCWAWWKR
jgi:hypothetical protein